MKRNKSNWIKRGRRWNKPRKTWRSRRTSRESRWDKTLGEGKFYPCGVLKSFFWLSCVGPFFLWASWSVILLVTHPSFWLSWVTHPPGCLALPELTSSLCKCSCVRFLYFLLAFGIWALPSVFVCHGWSCSQAKYFGYSVPWASCVYVWTWLYGWVI